jgi:tripartite-type tricarboxylate transporter receptor subunit TctC
LASAGCLDQPVKLMIPYSPGTMSSNFDNQISQVLTPTFGRLVIVAYRPGANGGVDAAQVAKAAPDGYTRVMAVNPSIYSNLGFEPLTNAHIVVLNAERPYKSVAELPADAKANPGKLSFGSAGNCSSTHLSGEMLKQIGHVNLVHVPYKGSGPALVDLMGNQLGLVISDTAAPAATLGPMIDINRRNQALAKETQLPAVHVRLKDFGVEPADAMSIGPGEALVRSDPARWKKFIAGTGIEVD